MKKLSVKWLCVISVPVIIASCTGCSTIRKAYWDHKVNELCEKNAGVTIYEKVEIYKSDYPDIKLTSTGKVILPSEKLAKYSDPFYISSTTEYLRKNNPDVWKYSQYIVRRSDNKILSKYVSYSRVGGDYLLFEGAFHPSYYNCPDTDLYISLQSSTIKVVGE